ncbi:hypothetical protein ASF55_11300 [Methylobacterium sp. Leaf119]|nr:hypothetical protein ASF55_11300 [Methylobacterium sp. Leaf119]
MPEPEFMRFERIIFLFFIGFFIFLELRFIGRCSWPMSSPMAPCCIWPPIWPPICPPGWPPMPGSMPPRCMP